MIPKRLEQFDALLLGPADREYLWLSSDVVFSSYDHSVLIYRPFDFTSVYYWT